MAITDSQDFINVIRRLKETEESLRKSQEGLEKAVNERTAELLQTNEKLCESEERFRTLFENAPVGIFVHDGQTGQVIAANRRALDSNSVSSLEELRARDYWMPEPYSCQDALNWVRKAAAEGPQQFEWQDINPKGNIIWRDVSLTTIVLDGIPMIVALAQDITKRKKIEEALRESEATYRGIIDSFSEAVYILDAQGKFIDVNKGAERMYGYTREELIGMSPADVSAPGKNDLALVMEKCQRVFAGEPQEMEFWGQAKDGHIFPKEVHCYPGEYFGKKVIVAIAQDITGRKRAEESLRESEEKYRGVVENIGIGIALISPQMEILSLNRKMQEWFPDICIGKKESPCYKAFNDPPRDAVCSYCPVVLTLQDGKVHEAVTETPSGPETINFRIVSSPVCNESGKVVAAIEMVENITDRVRAEERLRESEELYRLLTELSPNSVSVADTSGTIRMLNPKALELFGHERESEAIGRSIFEWVSQESQAIALTAFQELLRKGSVAGLELKCIRKDGTEFMVEINASVLSDSQGRPKLVIIVTSDITQRKHAEEERLKLQKLEAIGTLAGGIAHDFNNLLQGVFGYISMARLKIDQKDKAVAMLDQAEKALNMSVNLTTQLLTFAKGGKPVKKRIALKPVIENSAKFALSGSRCGCRLKLSEDLWHADADEGQICQVIQNIVLNASEAMPEVGAVEISAENVEIQKGINPILPEGGRFVNIRVRDTGIGISEQYLSKIFDPYFTTKQKGSGLGLASSYSIVKNHGGLIEVASEHGKGSTFTVYLPALDAGEPLGQTASVAVSGPRRRILLMDDEEMVRNIAGEMLEALGHGVQYAKDGKEAIEKYAEAMKSGNPFDIVILDLTIKGGMGGEETIKKIREIAPEVKAVVSSGYADNPVMADYKSYSFEASLNKPYRIEALKNCLNGLVEGE